MSIIAIKRVVLAGIVSLGFAGSAWSSVLVLSGDHPQSNEQNVLFKSDQTASPGTPITGYTDHSDTLVNFNTTTGQTLITSSLGQAKIPRMTMAGSSPALWLMSRRDLPGPDRQSA